MLTQSCRTHLIDERPQTHSFRDLGRDRESLRGVETSCSGFLTLLQLLLLLPSPHGGSIRWPLHLCRPLLIFGSVVAPRRISCAIAFCGRPFVSIDASLPRTISCFHYHSAALNQMCIFQPENAINCTFGYNTSAIIIL